MKKAHIFNIQTQTNKEKVNDTTPEKDIVFRNIYWVQDSLISDIFKQFLICRRLEECLEDMLKIYHMFFISIKRCASRQY